MKMEKIESDFAQPVREDGSGGAVLVACLVLSFICGVSAFVIGLAAGGSFWISLLSGWGVYLGTLILAPVVLAWRRLGRPSLSPDPGSRPQGRLRRNGGAY
jgi:protein-S-isoprenylcysteine O-methyltransferase Ste14